MRDGILEQLPREIPAGKIIFIAGLDTCSGVNHVKSLIQDLNREEKWIRAEFKTQVLRVPADTAVALTMVGISHGTLSTIRKSAKDQEILCLNQALTAGEVKTVLQAIHQIRSKKVSGGMGYKGSQNGNGNHPTPGKSEAQRLEELRTEAQRQTEQFTAAVQNGSVVEQQTLSEPPVQSAEEVEAALKVLHNFGSVVEETQMAVLAVADELKATTAKYVDLQDQLGAKEKEIAELKADLTNAHKIARENASIEEENKRLRGEVSRLQKAFDNLDTLIKGARGK